MPRKDVSHLSRDRVSKSIPVMFNGADTKRHLVEGKPTERRKGGFVHIEGQIVHPRETRLCEERPPVKGRYIHAEKGRRTTLSRRLCPSRVTVKEVSSPPQPLEAHRVVDANGIVASDVQERSRLSSRHTIDSFVLKGLTTPGWHCLETRHAF